MNGTCSKGFDFNSLEGHDYGSTCNEYHPTGKFCSVWFGFPFAVSFPLQICPSII